MSGNVQDRGRASDRPFTIARRFDAPREMVFAAWTDPEKLARWFGPKGAEIIACTNDARPGGVLHYGMRTQEGAIMWGKWVHCEVARPERLVSVVVFSDAACGDTRHPMVPDWPLRTLSHVAFDADGGGTRITIGWFPFDATAAERQAFEAAHGSVEQGWAGALDSFGDYLAKA
ncbi:MAG: SRPBCC domain-containing protein [Acetobacteraceae bacterium]|nr:SRPBCC domain-containing protein [Acetobacteraceae bacterium]